MKVYPVRTRRLRALHKLLRVLGISREAFKGRMGIISMDEWSDYRLLRKIAYLAWLTKQSWSVRHEHGATI